MNQVNPRRRLTPDEVLDIRSSTLTNKALGEQYGMSRSAVQRVRAGTFYKECPWPEKVPPRNTSRKLTPRQVLNIRASSLSNRTLAKKYKITTGIIHKIRVGYAYKDCGWPAVAPERHPVGKAANCKLTDDQVRQIRIDAGTGEMYKDIASRFNIDPATISNIMRGKTYTRVK